jgi:hypothetical protein
MEFGADSLKLTDGATWSVLSCANFGKQLNDGQRLKCGLKRVILLEAYFAQLVGGMIENED